jgi:hypothetical protein
VPAATETYKERDRQAKELEHKMARLGTYREAVERGEMTFEEAIQKVVEEERAYNPL